jgi:hypothetical protein
MCRERPRSGPPESHPPPLTGKNVRKLSPYAMHSFLGPNREGTDLCELRAVYEGAEKMQSGFECMNWSL